ncbi:helix-turn-helix domain-containing protein [Pedobacter sp. HMF7647]|uniref:Helix-turn-helix domain-containing protein n=1 Tax=Hufsiella arboris TaxID=2695275 RepID=A0A7K1YBI1_9SPHI|nr:helix-turn-helix domain-containing protein [Hufsiella arboris]MXV51933.1 helix-turn-helix domain-containing protein [Hufsiella arboris]
MEPFVLNFALSAGSALMLCFLFLSDIPKGNIGANKWLGAFYFCLACTFYQLYIDKAGLSNGFQILVYFLELSRWAVMPCFYYAIINFTDPEYSNKRAWVHFIPSLGYLLYSLRYIVPGFFGYPQQLPEFPFLIFILRYFFTGQLIFYWLLSFRKLSAHRKYLLQVASSIERIDLNWLKNLMLISLVMILLRFIPDKGGFVNNFIPLLYFSGMIFLAYYSIRQQPIFAIALPQSAPSSDHQSTKEVFERLEVQQVEALRARVTKVTREKKLYLDPSLSLPALSGQIGIGVQDLSYVLNNGLGKNFYEFINELRVEEAKALLESEKVKSLDMLGIATHAGFNSKTTFNTTFKKLTGLTPTEYLKSRSQSMTL